MTYDELISRTAAAIKRDNEAREAYDRARIEADAATLEMREAWNALRDHQDRQVAAALRLVA